MNPPFSLQPIGYFRSPGSYKANAPVQSGMLEHRPGSIELLSGHHYDQCLEGFAPGDLMWVIFLFHEASGWKPKVKPPRWSEKKVGIFATRSPHRPNPIGMSCVELLGWKGLQLHVGASDLIDGTPVLDIKPYIAYADAFPDKQPDWFSEGPEHELHYSEAVQAQLGFLNEVGQDLRAACESNLRYPPLLDERKRIKKVEDASYEFAYRTWRVSFELNHSNCITIHSVRSGYSGEEMASPEDPYHDKEMHRAFISRFA